MDRRKCMKTIVFHLLTIFRLSKCENNTFSILWTFFIVLKANGKWNVQCSDVIRQTIQCLWLFVSVNHACYAKFNRHQFRFIPHFPIESGSKFWIRVLCIVCDSKDPFFRFSISICITCVFHTFDISIFLSTPFNETH